MLYYKAVSPSGKIPKKLSYLRKSPCSVNSLKIDRPDWSKSSQSERFFTDVLFYKVPVTS